MGGWAVIRSCVASAALGFAPGLRARTVVLMSSWCLVWALAMIAVEAATAVMELFSRGSECARPFETVSLGWVPSPTTQAFCLPTLSR